MVRSPSSEAGKPFGASMLLNDSSMDVHFDVPEDLARQFGSEPGGIACAAIEALAAEGALR